mgnify:CR=1 FL=1
MKHKSFKGKGPGLTPGPSIHYEAKGVVPLITLKIRLVLILIGTIEFAILIRKIR